MAQKEYLLGRNLPNINQQVFLKECYWKEDMTRLKMHVKNEKYRERQKTGEFKMIPVLRERILGAVPKPGGYYRRVRLSISRLLELLTSWYICARFHRAPPSHVSVSTSGPLSYRCASSNYPASQVSK